MPNFKGGKGFKKRKKQSSAFREKTLIFKDTDENQEYGQIKKVNGSGRYQVCCFDGTERLGISAGNIKRRYRIQIDDIVLLSLWDFQDSKCSIIHKYDEDETRKLQGKGEFPDTIKLQEQDQDIDDDLFGYSDVPPTMIPVSESEEDTDEEEINLDDI